MYPVFQDRGCVKPYLRCQTSFYIYQKRILFLTWAFLRIFLHSFVFLSSAPFSKTLCPFCLLHTSQVSLGAKGKCEGVRSGKRKRTFLVSIDILLFCYILILFNSVNDFQTLLKNLDYKRNTFIYFLYLKRVEHFKIETKGCA